MAGEMTGILTAAETSTTITALSGIDSRRKYDVGIKSLLHFNYPYYAEANDGLGDDIQGFIWTRKGNAKLVGSESPADAIVANTPKFGYRCLQTGANTDYISGTNTNGIWNITGEREIDFWVRPTATTAGNIFTLMNGSDEAFKIAKNGSNYLTVSNGSTILTAENVKLTNNAWNYVKVSLTNNKLYIHISGMLALEEEFYASCSTTEVRLGGIVGQIDEFCYKHTANPNTTVGDEYDG